MYRLILETLLGLRLEVDRLQLAQQWQTLANPRSSEAEARLPPVRLSAASIPSCRPTSRMNNPKQGRSPLATEAVQISTSIIAP
jgi:hypothetical protein